MIDRYVIFSMLCLFLVSCSHVEKAKDVQMEATKAPSRVEIPSPIGLQSEKEKQVSVAGPSETFSFSLREADVKDVLRGIAKETHYNVVVEPDVKGLCTVDLKNVTLEKALEYIVEPLDLSYRIEGKTIYVSKPKLETKMFPINYIALRKVGFSSVFGNTGGTSTGVGAAPTGTTTTSGTGVSGAAGATGSTVILRSETDSDIWKSLEDNIKVLVSKEVGNVFVNRQANMVVVTDYPGKLKAVVKFLEGIEAIVHRQVMIEAKIVEVQLNDSYKEGINWQLINGQLWGYTMNVGQQLAAPVVLPTSTPIALTPIVAGATGAAATAPPFFSLFVGSGRPGSGLDISNTFVELVKTQGIVNVVSSPKIATMNNQRAVIKVAKQDVYFDVQQSTVTTGVGTVTYTPKFINEGLILDVIPQIDDAGNIILNIHPMLTTKVDQVAQPINTGGPTTYTYVPILDVRETDTMVKMKDGDTVIIGGLIQDYKIHTKKGIPGLMSIPLFSKLFSYTEETKTKIELVILLTPRIIYNKDGK